MPKWNSRKPVDHWDDPIPAYFKEHAAYLIEDLDRNQLSFEFQDHPEPNYEGHKKRFVEKHNPPWYRELWKEEAYRTHRGGKIRGPNGRFVKTKARWYRKKGIKSSKIKRNLVISALERIASGNDGEMRGDPVTVIRKYLVGKRRFVVEKDKDGKPIIKENGKVKRKAVSEIELRKSKKYPSYSYDSRLRDIIFSMLTNFWQDSDGQWFEPEKEVIDYFGVPYPEDFDAYEENEPEDQIPF